MSEFSGKVGTFKMLIAISVTCMALALGPSFPHSVFPEYSFHNQQRIIEALTLTFAAITIFFKYADLENLLKYFSGRISVSIFSFFFIGLVSSFFAYSLKHALHEWSTFLLLFILSALIASEIKAKGDAALHWLLIACGIGISYYLFHIFLIYLAFIIAGVQADVTQLAIGFSNYRFLNHTQTISIGMLALLLTRYAFNSKIYWFWFIISASWWSMLFVTGGRGTFVGLTVGVVGVWYLRRAQAKTWCWTMLTTGLVGLIIYFFFHVAIPAIMGLKSFGLAYQAVDRTLTNPTSGRTWLWSVAWQLIRENPFLGVGPQHYANYGALAKFGAHPHNWILQIAAEWGLPALASLILGIMGAWRVLFRLAPEISRDDNRNQTILAAWITIGIAILIDGLVSGLIVMPLSQLWITLFLGCAWGWSSRLEKKAVHTNDKSKSILRYRVAASLLITTILGLYWIGLFPEITNLVKFEQEALKLEIFQGIGRPRIWRAGYF